MLTPIKFSKSSHQIGPGSKFPPAETRSTSGVSVQVVKLMCQYETISSFVRVFQVQSLLYFRVVFCSTPTSTNGSRLLSELWESFLAIIICIMKKVIKFCLQCSIIKKILGFFLFGVYFILEEYLIVWIAVVVGSLRIEGGRQENLDRVWKNRTDVRNLNHLYCKRDLSYVNLNDDWREF